MNKLLYVQDISIASAITIIGIQAQDPSTTEKVLAALIRYSNTGIVEYAPKVAKAIQQELIITAEQYRQATHKLRKLNIIKTTGSSITLLPIAATPFDQLTIEEKK